VVHGSPQSRSTLGWAYLLLGHYEKAIATLKKAIAPNPDWAPPHVFLTIIYSDLNRHEEVETEATEILRITPVFSLELVRQRPPYKDSTVLACQLTALRKAGLP
jgi:tetratricopeptide (TPR) repeat protein